MKYRAFSVFALALPLAFATGATDAAESSHASGPAGPEAHWAYSGDEGPSQWGDLSSAYETCKTGAMQSPVNLEQPQGAGMTGLTFNYKAVPLKILNNGHTIQVNYGHGSTMTSGNQPYELLQLHFHTPSEHAVSGKQYPMEMHFVHKTSEGTLGVVGVFFTHGEENLALQEIWNHLPRNETGETPIKGVVINGDDLLPENRDYYRLIGSLTTPPCSENVQWHVFKEPIEASEKQIRAFTAIVGENARPLQPLNNRLLIDSGKAAVGGASAGAKSH